MRPVDPNIEGRETVVFAKDQPQYEPLPAVFMEPGLLLTRWTLSFAERQAILDGADVYLWVHTFGRPLQPVNLGVQGVDYDRAEEEVNGKAAP